MGENIGSIPTVHIASNNNYNKIKGLILISPIHNKMRILNGKKFENVYNILSLKNSSVPIYIIHGKSDSLINHINSQELSTNLNAYTWFPELGTHSKTLHLCRKKFFIKFNEFLDNISYINTRTNTTNSKQSSSTNCK
jgi:hypothetical protein